MKAHRRQGVKVHLTRFEDEEVQREVFASQCQARSEALPDQNGEAFVLGKCARGTRVDPACEVHELPGGFAPGNKMSFILQPTDT